MSELKPNEQSSQPQPLKVNATPSANGVTVYINGSPYQMGSAKFSGADLRLKPVPPISPNEHLFRLVSGKGDDIKLLDADQIEVNHLDKRECRYFFSDTIVPPKEEIAKKAFELYKKHGCKPGHDLENWSKAESNV